MPKHHARRLVLQVEQVKLLADLAMVALFGLCQPVQVLVLVLLFRPGGAVNPLEHLVSSRRASTAPATFISLNTRSLPVEGTCGPRHRSVKSPSDTATLSLGLPESRR